MRPTRCGACLLLGSTLLLAACTAAPPPEAPPAAAPLAPLARSTVVLLPAPDGGVGRVLVSNDAGASTLDRERAATRVIDARTAPSPPAPLSAAEVHSLFGEALSAQPPAPLHFTLYFEQGLTELTPESRREVAAVAAAVRERASVDTSVVGHSDTSGDVQKNLELSLRRAQAVGALLAAEGIDPGALDITSHGEANPLVPTGDDVSEPRNRRVEVTVR